MEEKYTAIIIGAGPAGSTAAYRLAQAGLEVLVIEKGTTPGSKNMFGGRMYNYALERVFPEFCRVAPVERIVVKEMLTFLGAEKGVSLVTQDENWSRPPYHSCTLLRAEFDAWLAQQAEAAGALLACGIRVDDLVWENDRVVGVRAGEDELRAEVVIAADGANSLIAQKAGLRPEIAPDAVGTGLKQVIELPAETIDTRFQLNAMQGLAGLYVGACTRGLPGGGFLYTNKQSISLGLVVKSSALAENRVSLGTLLEDFKAHPQVAPLIEGGRVAEFSAHLVPESGWQKPPPLWGKGILVAGDAAGFVINLGYQVRGMDLAIASGEAAAKTVIEAASAQDFSEARLGRYEEKLKEVLAWGDMAAYQKAPAFLENPRLYQEYPDLIGGMLSRMFTVDGSPPVHLFTQMMREFKHHQIRWLQATADAWKGGRVL